MLVVGLLVLAGACSRPGVPSTLESSTSPATSPAPAPTASTTSTTSTVTPPPAPAVLDERPLWSGAVTSRPGELGATFVGDALVQVGLEGGEDYRRTLSVVDAATGKVRWSLREEAALGGDGARLGFVTYHTTVLDADGDWSVVVQYEKAVTMPSGKPGREEGLAALSGADGSVRWRFPVLTDRRLGPATGEPWSNLTSFRANERYAVALVTRNGARNERTADTWIGFDLASRQKLWEVPWAAADGRFDLAGDMVVGDVTPVGKPVPELTGAGVKIVAGVDAATGRTRWTTAETPPSGTSGLTGTGVLITTGERGAQRVTLVDPVTGDQLWDPELTLTATDVRCRAGTRLLACHDDDGGIVVLDPATRKSTRFEPESGYELSRIWEDRLVLVAREESALITDRDGNPLVTPLPGVIRDLDADHVAVVVQEDPERGRLAVHRLPL
ncbi:hypothetical protein BLA60_01010 [Actinophytocola xinjiangensis]|uniref:Pyrrolo-quinoline quinone repeat domain-containing protein n=1 Tax=Actinophytocola xinjiangensis TaxID=485602 RepID=A0A7Z0WU16_9PSEU|nr:hypothetical protein BLA60_01010 [Actinophytocola xinjiangensis]